MSNVQTFQMFKQVTIPGGPSDIASGPPQELHGDRELQNGLEDG